ncbi:MAG: hypothetical protein KY437_07790, partial [Actinobacteria bacterium]|nr:hypothetical protein [Actinomycetota bacterium]
MVTQIRTVVVLVAVVALTLVSVVPASAEHEPEYDRKSDEWTLVEHLQFPQGTDLFFQRREGRQTLDGEVIDDTRDYLFAGNDASGAVGDPPEGEPLGINIYDVTDPTAPVELAVVDCPGYHADVAVYENLLIQAIDNTSGAGCADEFDPNGVDQPETAGIRILDISDP